MIKFNDILHESILAPRRSAGEREKNYKLSIQKKIQKYIKDGCTGNLDLSGVPFDVDFPNELTRMYGDLNLKFSKISKIPKNLTRIDGDLLLRGNDSIRSLGKLQSAYNIYADGCKRLISLPDNLHVRWRLYLGESSIRQLPEKLTVAELNIENTDIISIPDSVVVKTNLYAGDSQLSQLKWDFKTGYASIIGTPLLYTFYDDDGLERPADLKERLKKQFPNITTIYA